MGNHYKYRYRGGFLLFKNKLNITAEWYHRRTTDLLQKDVELPSSTGFSQISYFNSGELTNKGWEIMFNYDAVRKEDFKLSFNINFQKQK